MNPSSRLIFTLVWAGPSAVISAKNINIDKVPDFEVYVKGAWPPVRPFRLLPTPGRQRTTRGTYARHPPQHSCRPESPRMKVSRSRCAAHRRRDTHRADAAEAEECVHKAEIVGGYETSCAPGGRSRGIALRFGRLTLAVASFVKCWAPLGFGQLAGVDTWLRWCGAGVRPALLCGSLHPRRR